MKNARLVIAQRARIPLLGWWLKLTRSVEHREVLEKVHSEDGWSSHYAFMTLMSAGIAISGLILSSPAVVIGAMLISPLMGPIIGLGFGIALFDFDVIRRAGLAVGAGALLAILLCAFVVSVSPLQEITPEIASRTEPNLFDLLVALFSGLAGAYAMVRGRHGTIVGVAIATALMPPLGVIGYGLATQNWPVFWGSSLLFFTNLMTIAVSAAVLARIYGFAADLSPKQTGLQAAFVIGTLIMLAIPLGISLRQIAWEALAAAKSREVISEYFGESARLSHIQFDYDQEPIGISATVLTPEYRQNAERETEQTLTALLHKPVDVAIDQFRVGTEERAAAIAAELDAARADAPAPERLRAEGLTERLALVAGVPPDQVLVDSGNRRAIVRAEVLPGASLASYRVLERRVRASEPGWEISLIPPSARLPTVNVADGGLGDDAGETVATVIWAASRLNLPIGIDVASDDAAEALIATFEAAGLRAERIGEAGGEEGAALLRWLAPTAARMRPPVPSRAEEAGGN